MALNHIKQLLMLASVVMGFVSIFVFSCFAGILIGHENSSVGLKICAIHVWIKAYMWIINNKK